MDKLDFKPTDNPTIFLAEPYHVVHYDYSSNGGAIIEKPHWSAYHRIKCPVTHKWLFGDGVEHTERFKTKEYATKEEAIEACQKHFESEAGQQLMKDHKRYFKEVK